jgi:cardiolipin synthase (CMP-forming)
MQTGDYDEAGCCRIVQRILVDFHWHIEQMGNPALPSRFLALLPNALSLSRLLLGICFPLLSWEWRFVAVAIALLTDFLDGVLSRWLKLETITGRILDPTADKCFVLAVMCTWVYEGTLMPWHVPLIAARDIVVLLGGIWTIGGGKWSKVKTMAPSLLGKLATSAQFLLFGSALWLGRAELAGVLITGAISIAAAIDYARRYLRGHSTDAEMPPIASGVRSAPKQ